MYKILKHQRFTFWRIFWVVSAFLIFFLLISLISGLTSASAKNLDYDWGYIINRGHLISQGINMIAISFFFYISVNLYHRYFVEKRPLVDFIRLAILLFLGCGVFFYAKHKGIKIDPAEERTAPAMVYFWIVLIGLFYTGLAWINAYLFYLADEKKKQKTLEEQKMQLEVEKSSANLNFLKAQINPHFLHNTLNFLYAKSLPYSPELSEGILTLSDIMRYALSEGNARDGKAPLKDEIEHVWNVIKINQLRFSNTLNVEFTVKGQMDGITIIPFVLISIVENAFKHGDLKNQNAPIEINIEVIRNTLRFSCKNRKKTGPKELSTGVGLDNIRKRLDLAYGENYHFDIKDNTEFYTTQLTIDKL